MQSWGFRIKHCQKLIKINYWYHMIIWVSTCEMHQGHHKYYTWNVNSEYHKLWIITWRFRTNYLILHNKVIVTWWCCSIHISCYYGWYMFMIHKMFADYYRQIYTKCIKHTQLIIRLIHLIIVGASTWNCICYKYTWNELVVTTWNYRMLVALLQVSSIEMTWLLIH